MVINKNTSIITETHDNNNKKVLTLILRQSAFFDPFNSVFPTQFLSSNTFPVYVKRYFKNKTSIIFQTSSSPFFKLYQPLTQL
jgi:hypothetical protein